MILDAEDDIEVVGEASDGEQAVASASRFKPDVILMDVRMPNMDGIEATRKIVSAETNGSGTAAAPDGDPALDRPRVLMLTTFELDEYMAEAVREPPWPVWPRSSASTVSSSAPS